MKKLTHKQKEKVLENLWPDDIKDEAEEIIRSAVDYNHMQDMQQMVQAEINAGRYE